MPSSLLTRQAILIDAAASANRQQALLDKYPVDRAEVEQLANVDPTPNGTYTEFLVREFTKRRFGLNRMALDEAHDALVKFNRLKNSQEFRNMPNTHTDILAYDYHTFLAQMAEAGRAQLSKNEQERELKRRRQKYLDEGCELLTEQRGYAFFKVTTPEAAVLMGQGSHWCTKNEATARNYLRRGPLYVITQETEGGNYGSDRYAQFSIPSSADDIAAFECQDVDGNDFGSKEAGDRCYYFSNKDYWWLVEVLENYDEVLTFWVKEGYVFNDYDNMRYLEQCSECEKYVDENSEDLYYTDDGTFCCRSCFLAHYENKIEEEVHRLYHPDLEEHDKIAAEIEFYINSPESPEHKYFALVDQAKQVKYPDTEKWGFATQLSNARGCATVSQEKIDKVIPGVRKEDGERVYKHLKGLMDQLKDEDDLIEAAFDYVKEEFAPENMDVAEILREGGYIDTQPKNSSLLKKARKNIGATLTEEPEQADILTNYPIPQDIRTASLALKSEFENYKQGRKGTLENGLVDSFLKGSEVWKKLATALNSQNRRLVLQELSREGIQRGHANVRHSSQMGDGDPRR